MSIARHPAFRVAAAVLSGLVLLLVVLAVARPEMMRMAMLRDLFVGFGL
jgi:hypothetical protein